MRSGLGKRLDASRSSAQRRAEGSLGRRLTATDSLALDPSARRRPKMTAASDHTDSAQFQPCADAAAPGTRREPGEWQHWDPRIGCHPMLPLIGLRGLDCGLLTANPR